MFFNYDGEGEGDSEWEVLGYATCREQVLMDIRKLSLAIGEFELEL